jgi:hypothetical protein
MAGDPAVKKRDHERARRERQTEKSAQRRQRKEERAALIAQGRDPDIAGIVPGPQPKGDRAPASTHPSR